MKLIVGLGNPGRSYQMTRHNIGFLVLDELAVRAGISFRRGFRFPAETGRGIVGGERVRLVKPRTYMNRSGQAVAPFLRKEGVAPSDLLVVYDDVALEWGRLRIREQGSDGGHNGIRSVMEASGTSAFVRIRVGIGPKPDKVSLSDYVLGPFSEAERTCVGDVVSRAADAVEMVCRSGTAAAMNSLNREQDQGEKR